MRRELFHLHLFAPLVHLTALNGTFLNVNPRPTATSPLPRPRLGHTCFRRWRLFSHPLAWHETNQAPPFEQRRAGGSPPCQAPHLLVDDTLSRRFAFVDHEFCPARCRGIFLPSVCVLMPGEGGCVCVVVHRAPPETWTLAPRHVSASIVPTYLVSIRAAHCRACNPPVPI